MKSYPLRILFLALAASGCLCADDLSWGNTYSAVWSGFGVSPYTAIDSSQNNLTLKIFCLDFNDEIAPPIDWQATILALNPNDVQNYSQFGGKYGNGITPTAGGVFAFQGDTPADKPSDPHADQYAVHMTSNDPYTRYLEAAWLFTNIEGALANRDTNDAVISQAAAWDLFIEAKNQTTLRNDINGTTGAWTFNNYEYATSYATSAPQKETGLPSGLSFEEAVDEALNAAQNAIAAGWASSQYFGTWNLVTGTQAFVNSYGIPVQEFLSPTPAVNSPIPEPSAIILLATVAAAIAFGLRRAASRRRA